MRVQQQQLQRTVPAQATSAVEPLVRPDVTQAPGAAVVQAPIPSGSDISTRKPAPVGSSRLFDVRLKTLSGTDSTDGLAFCARTFADISKRVARGEKCRVVFDLDNTLFDTRARSMQIGRAFDAANGTSYFQGISVDKIGRDGSDIAEKLGMPAEIAGKFSELWNVEFWRGDNLVNDTPMASMVALAKRAKSAGADVVYLTGRNTTLQPASLAQLVRAGLPGADAEHLFCKPVGARTPAFKAEQLGAWTASGTHIGFFVTEGRHDIAKVQQDTPGVPCLLLPCSLERSDDAVKVGTPVLPGIF